MSRVTCDEEVAGTWQEVEPDLVATAAERIDVSHRQLRPHQLIAGPLDRRERDVRKDDDKSYTQLALRPRPSTATLASSRWFGRRRIRPSPSRFELPIRRFAVWCSSGLVLLERSLPPVSARNLGPFSAQEPTGLRPQTEHCLFVRRSARTSSRGMTLLPRWPRADCGVASVTANAVSSDGGHNGAANIPVKMNKVASAKLAAGLVERKLMREVRAKRGMPVWRRVRVIAP
jgi:hypothetical protein